MKTVSSGFAFKRSDVAEVSVHDEDHVDSPVIWVPASTLLYKCSDKVAIRKTVTSDLAQIQVCRNKCLIKLSI